MQMPRLPPVSPTAPVVHTHPVVNTPLQSDSVNDPYLPPSYDQMYGGGAVGGAGFDDESILEDADWYQAGLPRCDINNLIV